MGTLHRLVNVCAIQPEADVSIFMSALTGATCAWVQIVQEGAALAPGWTEAMFHELLDQEAAPASGAALHHAADIMSLHDTAKAHYCMAGMQQTISGACLMRCVIGRRRISLCTITLDDKQCMTLHQRSCIW